MSVELQCPSCGKTNRVPPETITDDPRCRDCDEPLAPGLVGVDIPGLFEAVSSDGKANAASASADAGVGDATASRDPPQSAIRFALRSTGLGSNEPMTHDRRLLMRSGLWGVLLGPPLMATGAIAGTLLINMILSALDVRGEVTVPALVLGLAYFGALYGGLVTLTASTRILGSIWPGSTASRGLGRVARLALAVFVGFAELIAVWAVIHVLGLADFWVG